MILFNIKRLTRDGIEMRFFYLVKKKDHCIKSAVLDPVHIKLKFCVHMALLATC